MKKEEIKRVSKQLPEYFLSLGMILDKDYKVTDDHKLIFYRGGDKRKRITLDMNKLSSDEMKIKIEEALFDNGVNTTEAKLDWNAEAEIIDSKKEKSIKVSLASYNKLRQIKKTTGKSIKFIIEDLLSND